MPVREATASVGQRLLWFLDHYRVNTAAALNCPVVCRLDGPLDNDRLRHALRRLLERHEALRTMVERRGRQLWQTVHGVAEPQLHFVDLRTEDGAEEVASKVVDEELRRRIDPLEMPVRATLLRTGPLRHLFCLNAHHAGSDAWSGAIQMRDLRRFYAEPDVAIPPPALQYIDFTLRQEDYFRGDAFSRDLRYWRSHLAGAEFDSVPLTPAPTAKRSTARARITFGSHETALLKALARNCRGTLFGVLLSLYFAAIHRVTGRNDSSVTSLFANRMSTDIQETVGFIANLAVLRCAVVPGMTFRSMLHSIQAEIREALLRQACPLHVLPSDVTIRNGRRADEVVFQMLPQALDRTRMSDIDVTMIAPEAIESRFELEITAIMEQDTLSVLVSWNRARLTQEWVEVLLHEYRMGAGAVLGDADWRIGMR